MVSCPLLYGQKVLQDQPLPITGADSAPVWTYCWDIVYATSTLGTATGSTPQV